MVQGLVLEEESVWFLLWDLAVEGSEFEVERFKILWGIDSTICMFCTVSGYALKWFKDF